MLDILDLTTVWKYPAHVRFSSATPRSRKNSVHLKLNWICMLRMKSTFFHRLYSIISFIHELWSHASTNCSFLLFDKSFNLIKKTMFNYYLYTIIDIEFDIDLYEKSHKSLWIWYMVLLFFHESIIEGSNSCSFFVEVLKSLKHNFQILR